MKDEVTDFQLNNDPVFVAWIHGCMELMNVQQRSASIEESRTRVVDIYAYMGETDDIGWRRCTNLLRTTRQKACDLAHQSGGSVELAILLLQLIHEPVPYCPARSANGRPCGHLTEGRWCPGHRPIRRRRAAVARRAAFLLRRRLPVDLVQMVLDHLRPHLMLQDHPRTL